MISPEGESGFMSRSPSVLCEVWGLELRVTDGGAGNMEALVGTLGNIGGRAGLPSDTGFTIYK